MGIRRYYLLLLFFMLTHALPAQLPVKDISFIVEGEQKKGYFCSEVFTFDQDGYLMHQVKILPYKIRTYYKAGANKDSTAFLYNGQHQYLYSVRRHPCVDDLETGHLKGYCVDTIKGDPQPQLYDVNAFVYSRSFLPAELPAAPVISDTTYETSRLGSCLNKRMIRDAEQHTITVSCLEHWDTDCHVGEFSSLTIQYDEAGRILSYHCGIVGGLGQQVTFRYNALGQVSHVRPYESAWQQVRVRYY